MESLVIVYSYHHMNTEKVAKAMARVLGAEIMTPREVDVAGLSGYDLIGFGSGIDSEKHYRPVLDLAEELLEVDGKRAFIFSTCGPPEIGMSDEYVAKCHSTLRERLRSKGYEIVDEFSCLGWNTNSFLKLFGGINKGRPNEADLQNAMAFAEGLMAHQRA